DLQCPRRPGGRRSPVPRRLAGRGPAGGRLRHPGSAADARWLHRHPGRSRRPGLRPGTRYRAADARRTGLIQRPPDLCGGESHPPDRRAAGAGRERRHRHRRSDSPRSSSAGHRGRRRSARGRSRCGPRRLRTFPCAELHRRQGRLRRHGRTVGRRTGSTGR
ncbi:hypothetical protein OY671_011521, partial [Metschnikowia pulcherrima]